MKDETKKKINTILRNKTNLETMTMTTTTTPATSIEYEKKQLC